MIRASRNQLGNLKNQYQTEAHKVLCLCSAGMLRSPTLANVLHKEYGWNTRSAGVTREYALIPVSEALIKWADMIVCVTGLVYDGLMMDKEQAGIVDPSKILVLDIPDEYEWNNETLKEVLLEQFNRKNNENR